MATVGDISKHVLGNTILAQLTTRYPTPKASLEGRTYIVTGANTGLGLALATHLARLNASRVILAVRDIGKGNTARETILQETQFLGVLEVWELDMARFASVAQFARKVETLDRLDGAALNAGVSTRGWHTTPDGWETTFQVNALSTGLLAVLLLPLLQRTVLLADLPNSEHIPPHLTITGSGGQNVAKFQERFEDNILQAMNDESKFNSFDRYPTSKLFNYFISKKVAVLTLAQGVTVNVVDPGMNHSELPRDAKLPLVVRGLIQLLAWPASKGALNILYGLLAATPSGAYISRTRMQSTAKWLDTEHGEQVRDRAWAEMVALWDAEVPHTNVRDIINA
ncbi:ATP-dependent DNA helicase PIF1 [Mycena venus]|uniref:ATP-dependent DNA helicase PIF1 n=1 Tax=Mycena venus TaxID=2733690 RepID=A0A8H6X7B9_9AGAR|nr:ATP-dependent DNA helicase PIF1 [Mycena venus]